MHDRNIMKERVVRLYFTLSSLFAIGMMVTTSTYVMFLREHGMSLLQVNLVNSVFFVTLFLCEIPTGAFADIFGRTWAFILACIFRGLGSLIYGLSETFWGFITAEIVAAIGFTFANGAFKAWLVDSLLHRGYSQVDIKVFSRAKFLNQFCGSLSCIVGSYMSSASLSLPWFVGSAIDFIVGVIAFMTMKEEYFVRHQFSWSKGLSLMRTTAASSIRYAVNDKAVRFILVMTFVQIFSVQALNMYWQPFFAGRGVSKIYFGYIFTGMMFALALGAYLTSLIPSGNREKSLIVWSQVFVGCMVIAAVSVSSLPLVIALFITHEVGRGFWEPIKDKYLHTRIPSHERATIDSFCSISPHIGGAIGLFVSGNVAQVTSIEVAWIMAGSTLILGAILIARNGYRH
jgi:MFS family permease